MLRNLSALIALACTAGMATADDWPQWLGTQRDGVWREQGILTKFPQGGPKVLWKAPVGLGYAGPAVANGRLYLMDWMANPGIKFAKGSPVRNLPGKERILCLDATNGKLLWTHQYDCFYDIDYPSGPRCTPTVSGGKVYTLGAMGNLCCLDADSGRLLWAKDFLKDYPAQVPFWGYASHPLVDGDRLICLVGGKGSAVVAFQKDTGKELWRNLSASEVGYSPPTIHEFGGKRQLIVWHPESVNGLEPETGKLYWTQPFGTKPGKGAGSPKQIGAGMSIVTPRKFGDLLFVTAFYDGAMMLKVNSDPPTARVMWQSNSRGEKPDQTDALHCVFSTPLMEGDYIYGVCSYGELRCIEARTGKRVWETHNPVAGDSERWGSAFLIPHGDRVFLFNEKGELMIGKLTPTRFEEMDRVQIIAPTNRLPGRQIVWVHPAFANRCIYVRNDEEMRCISLAADQ